MDISGSLIMAGLSTVLKRCGIVEFNQKAKLGKAVLRTEYAEIAKSGRFTFDVQNRGRTLRVEQVRFQPYKDAESIAVNGFEPSDELERGHTLTIPVSMQLSVAHYIAKKDLKVEDAVLYIKAKGFPDEFVRSISTDDLATIQPAMRDYTVKVHDDYKRSCERMSENMAPGGSWSSMIEQISKATADLESRYG